MEISDYSFPSAQATASNEILVNDGSGILTWVDPKILVTSNAWYLTGNASTNPAIDFIGTIDATDFVFRTNSVEKMRILSDGYIGIGINTPQRLIYNKTMQLIAFKLQIRLAEKQKMTACS